MMLRAEWFESRQQVTTPEQIQLDIDSWHVIDDDDFGFRAKKPLPAYEDRLNQWEHMLPSTLEGGRLDADLYSLQV